MCVLLLGGGLNPAVAELETHKRIETYDVSAKSLRALKKALEAPGSDARPYPQNFAGLTTTLITWEASYEAHDAGCRVTDWLINVDTVIQLPRWVEAAKVSKGAKARWENYRLALEYHEDFHHRLSVEAAKTLDWEIAQLDGAATCEELKDQVDWLYSAMSGLLNAEHQFYDAMSTHGRTQERYYDYLEQQRVAAASAQGFQP